MAHVLILGMTMSGKTTLGRGLAAEYGHRGIGRLVLDPIGDPRWPADRLTTDPEEFLAWCQQARGCAVFIDEAGEVVGRYQDEQHWLATRSRHYGHRAHFLAQRAQQIAPLVRDQCTTLFLFRVSLSDAKLLADEWGREELRQAHTLGQGEYFAVTKFGACRRCRLPGFAPRPALRRVK